MTASRAIRVPQIKRCIEKGIQQGFDGVLLNYFDWGTENDRICFCDTCIADFCKYIGKKLSREELATKLIFEEGIVSAWWDWKMRIRNDIALEFAKFARETALKYKRDFWVGQCAGAAGTNPNIVVKYLTFMHLRHLAQKLQEQSSHTRRLSEHVRAGSAGFLKKLSLSLC